MSEREKQEIIDRLFQGHEVRLRVLEKILSRITGALVVIVPLTIAIAVKVFTG